MILTIPQIRQIIAAGGSLDVDGSAFTLAQLKQIAEAAATVNVRIKIRNIGNLTWENLKEIASLAPDKIVFDLT
jgi:hypothetical protein